MRDFACRFSMPDMPILLCLFHVMTSWAKSLHSKVKDKRAKATMARDLTTLARLNDASFKTDSERRARMQKELEEFYARHAAQEVFIAYFKRHWEPKVGKLLGLLLYKPM